MKRYGYVFERIISMENLESASKKACSSRKNKQEIAEFKKNAKYNLE